MSVQPHQSLEFCFGEKGPPYVVVVVVVVVFFCLSSADGVVMNLLIRPPPSPAVINRIGERGSFARGIWCAHCVLEATDGAVFLGAFPPFFLM